MNCHLAITRVKFVYLIDACVLRRKLNRRFHNKRRMREERANCEETGTIDVWLDMPCDSNSADLSISMVHLQSTDF